MDFEIKRKCTIKERKQAARILAARENLLKINDDILQRVGSMSDNEVLNFLDNEASAAAAVLDPLEVEEIKPGTGADLEAIYKNLVDVVNNYIVSNNWDVEKISPLQWAACCLAAGRFANSRSFFRGIPENENTNNGIKQYNASNGVNVAAVAGALPVWLELCAKCNKTPLKSDFLAFVGLSFDWLYNYKGVGVTSERDEILKILETIQADGLRKKVINPKESPIGAIFLLKADHGLVEAQRVQHEYLKPDASGAALPVFGSYDPITDENAQK